MAAFQAEWYFDAAAQKLYFASNSSSGAAPSDAAQLEAVQAEVLVNITGSQVSQPHSILTSCPYAPSILTPCPHVPMPLAYYHHAPMALSY